MMNIMLFKFIQFLIPQFITTLYRAQSRTITRLLVHITSRKPMCQHRSNFRCPQSLWFQRKGHLKYVRVNNIHSDLLHVVLILLLPPEIWKCQVSSDSGLNRWQTCAEMSRPQFSMTNMLYLEVSQKLMGKHCLNLASSLYLQSKKEMVINM